MVKLRVGRSQVLLLGTAHVSAESVRDVEAAVAVLKPDLVAIELCAPRYQALNDRDRWQNLDIGRVIREGKLWLLASNLALAAFQKRIGELTGVAPGAEMLRAAELAKKSKARLALIDREVRTTLARAWARVGFFSRLWLGSSLLASLLVRDDIDPAEIEELKRRDVFESMLDDLPPRYAPVRQVIIDERDQYLAESLRRELADGKTKRALVVLGAGHLPGVERILREKQPVNLDELSAQPPRRRYLEIARWTILGLLILGISAYVFISREADRWQQIQQAILWWAGLRAAGGGLGALLAGVRPLNSLITAALAPLSFFLGFVGIRLSMITALLELRSRRPSVQDFEGIASETETFRGFVRALYQNPVLHLIFLFVTVGWGLLLSTIVYFSVVLPWVAAP